MPAGSAAPVRVVYGIHAVCRALAAGLARRVFLQEDLGPQRLGRVGAAIAGATVPVERRPRDALAALAGTESHQGVVAEVRAARPMDDHEALAYLGRLDEPLLLVLDSVQDPRNFGSLLRTADAAGVDLVAWGRSRNVGLTPVVSKVASGAAEVQPMAEVANLARFLAALRDAGVRVIGTDEEGPRGLHGADLTGALALVMGAEGAGLRRLTRDHCDELLRIPMHGSVESLNVAVAAGVCLYEAVRQRALRHPEPSGTMPAPSGGG